MNKDLMLEQLINYYSNGNKSLFAKKLGVKPQTINSWIKRNTFDYELIYANCENVSADWLLSGEGEMLNEENHSSVSMYGDHNQVNGEGAQGNINGGTTVDVAVLQERIKAMQQLLQEKERTIKILMEK